jgi:tetratricopeptide (TPR) repeat protein
MGRGFTLVVAVIVSLLAPADSPAPAGIGATAAAGSADTVARGSDSAATAETLARYRQRAEALDRPLDWYNLGAALLLSGDWQGALSPLARALENAGPGLEVPATYNLGLAHALGGRPPDGRPPDGGKTEPQAAPGSNRREGLERARDAFRWVLRSDPDDEDARWNLELVERWLRADSRATSEGAGSGGAAGGGKGPAEPMPELSPEEAEALLEAAATAERAVQKRRLERNRTRDPVVQRNW